MAKIFPHLLDIVRHGEIHFSGSICQYCVFLRRQIVEELAGSFSCLFCWKCLPGCNGAEGCKNGEVDSTTKVEELSSYPLFESFLLLVQWLLVVLSIGVLHLCTVLRSLCRIGAVLAFCWHLMSKLYPRLLDIVRHGEMHFSEVVVPV